MTSTVLGRPGATRLAFRGHFGTSLAVVLVSSPEMVLAVSGRKGEIAMKRICYLMWLAGMAGLVAYGFSDSILDQAAGAAELVGQVVAFVTI